MSTVFLESAPGAFMGVDDELSDIERFEMYVNGEAPVQRLVYVKRICEIARSLEIEDIETRVFKVLKLVAIDVEHVIRQSLGIEMKSVLLYLDTLDPSEVKHRIIMDKILPILHVLLMDHILEVREAASTGLLTAAALLPSRDIEIGLVSHVILLLDAEIYDDEQKGSALSLIATVSSYLDASVIESVISPLFTRLACHSNFRIRKACAQNFGVLSKASDSEFVVKYFLPSFKSLLGDPIWSVRKGCVESIVDLSSSVTRNDRESVLVPAIIAFTSDVSRWVRNGAYKILGTFIHSLEEELISKQLLALYAGIPSLSPSLVDSDSNYYCAFSFPAVVSRVGVSRWSELEPAFQALCRDNKFRVRRTLAFSLHEVALLLGSELTEEFLIGPFEMFLKDLSEVKEGAITHIAKFISALSQPVRISYISALRAIQKASEQNWRFRCLLALQFEQFSLIYPIDTIATDFLPLLLGLTNDNIAYVRAVAVTKYSNYVNILSNYPEYYAEFLQEIRGFATSETYMHRILYIRICSSLVQNVPYDLFEKEFLFHLIQLSRDPVSNVRLALAEELRSSFMSSNCSFNSNRSFQIAHYTLSTDAIGDIRSCLPMVSFPLPSEEDIHLVFKSEKKTDTLLLVE